MLLAAATFAAGLLIGHRLTSPPAALKEAAIPAIPVTTTKTGYPAEVVRVIDGDTFEARVHVWLGMDVTTKIRLRGIDAPELKARCGEEYDGAQAARDALARMLAQGDIGVTQVGQDKYGGRVLANVSTRNTPDVSAALLEARVVRNYGGGKRESWCRN
jgi:endonuclease YncB( thermonuclease family)